MQAAQANGKTIEEWYELPIEERTAMVASAVVPGWMAELNARYAVARRV